MSNMELNENRRTAITATAPFRRMQQQESGQQGRLRNTLNGRTTSSVFGRSEYKGGRPTREVSLSTRV